MSYLKAENLVSGQEGRAYVKLDGQNRELLYLKNVTATVEKKKQAVRTLYESPSLEGLHEWGVGYVVISSWERSDYQVQEDWFQQNCTLLYQSGEYQLYQVPAL